ncbi:pseudo-response regulator 5 protein [Dioscorea alata]|uniref:Pseudo-response regulator 5 protein n=1 Tax=Dioscorea alata TaxID=55571 RepID=A0ACB7W046_DIOAL|nr:pseudo-response regulator 5 protein [Dioscorea alata]
MAAAAPSGAGRAPSKYPSIRWERVLPRRSLRVLLVEHDDSTRHIVTALLRKCGYHVAAVADGVKAWEVLIEKEFNFDLVLAEVDMPSLSGIGLLSRIMGTEGCKNIPVIMMSSHDSVSVVLKCMLKGAVDFLVKPVRKNELQNLWQHVWRKHCSSSSANVSDNNAASNHISVNASEMSETGENSDEGNHAFQSGGRPVVDIGVVQKSMEPLQDGGGYSKDEVEAKQDQVDERLTMDLNDGSGDKSLGIPAEVTLPVPDSSLVEQGQKAECSYKTIPFRDEAIGFMRLKQAVSINPSNYCHNNFINEPSSTMNCFMENGAREVVYESARSFHKEDGSYHCSSSFMEFDGCPRQESRERHFLKHSNNSAFSRYGYEKICPSNPHGASTLWIRTTDCVDQSISHPSTDRCDDERNASLSPGKRLASPQMNVDETPLNFQVPPNSNNDDTGFAPSEQLQENACIDHSSTREDASFCHPQLGYIPLPIPMGAIPYQTLCAGHHSILQPVFHRDNALSGHGSRAIGEHIAPSCIPVDQSNPTGSCSHDMMNVSWSNCSGETSTAVVNRGNALESGNESGVQNCNRKVLGHEHSRRAAALVKFRLKRKERCFEKKVRYFSRQKLAEQRPRVKGQFVRQKGVGSSKTTDTEE